MDLVGVALTMEKVTRIELRVGDKVRVYDTSLPTGQADGVVLDSTPEMPDWKIHVELDDYRDTWNFHWKQIELVWDIEHECQEANCCPDK